MTPGTYLRKRRLAAGLTLGEVGATADHALLAIEQAETDVLVASRQLLEDLRRAYPFNQAIYHGLVRGLPMQVCRACACSEYDACDPACSWAEPDLCSACKRGAVLATAGEAA